MDAFLGKKYKLDKSENFDEYMKAIGVSLVTRKVGNSTSSTVSLTKNGDTWTFKTESTFKNQDISFKLGQEFDEDTIDGRKVKTTFTLDGNKLTQVQKASGDAKDATLIREFFDDHMTTVCKAGDVVCTRTFKAV